MEEQHSHKVKIYLHQFNTKQPPLKFDFHKRNTAGELIECILRKLDYPVNVSSDVYELAEIMGTLDGQTCKERKIDRNEYPVAVQLLWPKSLPVGPDETSNLTEYRFVFREKRSKSGGVTRDSVIDSFLQKFLQQPKDKEYPDLCMLTELTEQTLLENLKERFQHGHIYTYIGPILVAVNPFKFYPIYNPKYAKLYENRRLGDLPPHIFAIADTAYHSMLKQKRNQCVVISGESGSGKTESTNFLLHHLTTLSQKGATATGIEQTLLCAGPVLEAFGNSVTAQNNNSSRFGKFIQVNYRENGMVYGANVQIYLLEKSRIISQASDERNYHVFYYLLAGATDEERDQFFLLKPDQYHYLNQNNFYTMEGVDEQYEFRRLKQSMELVGFSQESFRKIFCVLSAVLLLGNVHYVKKSGYHSDDTALIGNQDVVTKVSQLLQVKEDKLINALTTKRTVTKNDVVVTRYKLTEAQNARDAMAKCLYNALFDWIVLKINQALIKRDTSAMPKGYYIGILDIFGFEDVGAQWNSFEQFCINYTNERLQAYFNQHIFQFEQEEYLNQGITWTNIEYTDNTECLHLIQVKPYGLFSLIDEECSVPKGTDETLLEKFHKYHKTNEYYETPQKKEMAFIIAHYAGKVKYQITGFKEKNKDLMRQDVVNALKNSKSAFVRELVGTDPVAVFRWAVVRASFRALFAFKQAGLLNRRAESAANLLVEKPLPRRSSESQLNALLRGDIDRKRVPSFCDTSVFSTIVDHVNLCPCRGKCDACKCSTEDTADGFSQDETSRHRRIIRYFSVISKNYRNNNYANDIPSSNNSHNTVANSNKNCQDDEQDQDNVQDESISNGIARGLWVRSRVLRYEDKALLAKYGSPFKVYPADTFQLPTHSKHLLNDVSETIIETEELILKKAPSRQRRSQKGLKGLQALKALVGKRPAAGRKILSTVGAQFQHSLSRLMDSLSQADPFFIRCIKSNNDKVPCLFDEDITLRQLRYTGMLETVRIRRAGYSVRLTYEEFMHQYRILLPKGVVNVKEAATNFITEHPILDRQNVQFGNTKIFMRDAEKLLLDDQLHRLIMSQITRLQSWFRTFLLRQRFLRTRKGVVKIQACIRGWMVRNRLQKEAMAALCVQTHWRSYHAAKQYVRLKRITIQFQAYCRGFLLRRKFATLRDTPDGLKQLTLVPRKDLKFDIKIGSPDHSDEGILTKASSQDDVQLSISPPGFTPRLKFETCDSDGSSGILDDESYRMLHDRSTSLDATFILEESKLKLVEEDDALEKQRNRRPSLVPTSSTSSERLVPLRRSASSDHLLKSRIDSDATQPMDIDFSKTVIPTSPPTSPLQPASEKKRRGFFKAKRHIRAFLSLKGDDIPSEEDSDEDKRDEKLLIIKKEKPKALSLMPGDQASFAATSVHSHALKLGRFNKVEPCALCAKNVGGFLSHGYKCQTCKLSFHKECNQFACKFPCQPQITSPQSPTPIWHRPWEPLVQSRKSSKQQTTATEMSPPPMGLTPLSPQSSKWSLTRTSQFSDPTDQVISSTEDLRQMSIFIFKKMMELSQKSQKQRDTVMDSIFKKSLQEFHTELLSYQAALKEDQITMKYKDLIISFEGTLSKVCMREQTTFPVTLGLNAFRVFMNEFVTTKRKLEKTKAKQKASKKKTKKSDVQAVHLNHRFKADIVHVPTYCELCNQFMWHSEKILICIGCRISCHKKCYQKITHPCTASSSENLNVGAGRVFGADLLTLVDEEHSVPVVLEKLLICIEVQGLFFEGLYRKSGSMVQMKQCRKLVETAEDFDQLNFDDVPVHVMTALVKAFFRELPEPLLTFDLYENFLNVSEVKDEKERLRCIYAMIDLLPKANRSVFERLMYHLSRVAHHAEVNKMSSQNLAVIFAPCVLKRQQVVKAQEQLEDVNRQTICLETLINEKLRQYVATLSDIVQLENAVEKVTENIHKIDQHLHERDEMLGGDDVKREIEQARLLFMEQLDYLDQEKDKLIEELPPLAPVASSEDDCVTSSSDEVETPCVHRRLKFMKQTTVEEYAVDFSIPPLFSNLIHWTKNRAPRPKTQRKPRKYAKT